MKNETQHSLFNLVSTLRIVKEEIPVNTLPENIKEYSSQNLNSDKLNKAVMLTNEFGVIIFKVEINGTDYLFGVEGNFISRESDYDYFEKYEDNEDGN